MIVVGADLFAAESHPGPLRMPPSILDYNSDCPTYALAFSPLSTSTQSLKLAVGSFVEARGDNNNNVTICALDQSYLDLEDVYDDPNGAGDDQGDAPAYARARDGSYVKKGSAFVPIARTAHPYPPSSIGFSPARLSSSLQSSNASTMGEGTREMVATSSDCLRLYDLVDNDDQNMATGGFVGRQVIGAGSRLVPRAQLANTKADYSAPLTSFSWSTLEPTHIVTSSIDTTCTVWDISTSVPITQLIAHDREVYDVAWSPSSREVFASVGADGSVRMFDLRSLEHSTILYEATPAPASSSSSSTAKNGAVTSPNPSSSSASAATPGTLPSPLLRLAFSPTSPTYVSVCHADSADVQILDTRSPGTPAMEVRGHSGAVNGMAWGGSTISSGGETVGPGWLATCSDDSTLLLWDLSNTTPNPPPTSRSAPAMPKLIQTPVLSWSAPSEINAVAWGGGGDWVAAGCGRLVRCLKFGL
ncbi:hypothetical protein RQP46_006396 [Phenoliferia psychrophenolica]